MSKQNQLPMSNSVPLRKISQIPKMLIRKLNIVFLGNTCRSHTEVAFWFIRRGKAEKREPRCSSIKCQTMGDAHCKPQQQILHWVRVKAWPQVLKIEQGKGFWEPGNVATPTITLKHGSSHCSLHHLGFKVLQTPDVLLKTDFIPVPNGPISPCPSKFWCVSHTAQPAASSSERSAMRSSLRLCASSSASLLMCPLFQADSLGDRAHF